MYWSIRYLNSFAPGAPRMYLMHWFWQRNQDPSKDTTSAWVLGRWSISSPFQVFLVWMLPIWQKCSEGAGLIGISCLKLKILKEMMFYHEDFWSLGNTEVNRGYIVLSSCLFPLFKCLLHWRVLRSDALCFFFFFSYLPVQPTGLRGAVGSCLFSLWSTEA